MRDNLMNRWHNSERSRDLGKTLETLALSSPLDIPISIFSWHLLNILLFLR